MAQAIERGSGKQPVGRERLIPLREVEIAGDDRESCASARVQAISRRALPYCFSRRRMPWAARSRS